MREIRLSGSVRGAGREVRPYRDLPLPMRKHGAFRSPRPCCRMEPLKQASRPEGRLADGQNSG